MSKFDPKPYLIKLGGKDYLQVAYRVQWFRTEHPAGRIETDVVNMEPLLVKAAVYDADGHMLATGHGGADAGARKVVWSGREFEKAETAAIGRALAHAGYGTQFTGEDEGEHLADSPLEHPAQNGRAFKKPSSAPLPGKPDALIAEGAALATGAPWTVSDGNPGKFLAWAGKTHGLTSVEVCEALAVPNVTHYAGSKEDAIAALLAYVEARTAPKP
jgi:hypothetical protein